MKLRTLIYMLIASLALQSTLCATVEDLIKSLQNLQTLQLQLLGALQNLSKTPGEKESTWERLEKWAEGTYPAKLGTPGFPKKIPAPFWVDMAPGPLRIISKDMPYPLHWVASFVPPYVDKNDTKECDKQSAPGIEYVINHQDWKKSARSIDELDGDGKTALQVAVENDRPLTAQELIRFGAKVTPAIIAKAKNDEMRAVLKPTGPAEPGKEEPTEKPKEDKAGTHKEEPKEKPTPKEEPKKEEKGANKITLPGAEYQFLFNHSFRTSIEIVPDVFEWLKVPKTEFEVHDLETAVTKFIGDMQIPDEKQAPIMPKALEIGARVFKEAVTEACEKYIAEHKKAAHASSDPKYVANHYFTPVCREIINLAIIQAAYNKKNLVELAGRVGTFSDIDVKALIKKKLQPSEVLKLFQDLTSDDRKLLETQFEAAKDNLNAAPPAVTTNFIAAQNAAVAETIRLLKLWYEASTAPKFEKVKAFFKDNGVEPEKAPQRGDVDLLRAYRKVLFLPKMDQLIQEATGDDRALFAELKEYIKSDQYLIDGISLTQIDKIILKHLKMTEKKPTKTKKALTSPNAEILAALQELAKKKDSIGASEVRDVLSGVRTDIMNSSHIKWKDIFEEIGETGLAKIKAILSNVKSDLNKTIGFAKLYQALEIS